jgi:UPF0755 protein
MGQALARYFIAFMLVIAAIAITIASIINFYINSPGPLRNEVNIIFEKGSNIKEFVAKLERQHVINHPKIFLIILGVTKSFKSIKAGEYGFSVAITPKQIIDILIAGKSVLHRITIPEGISTREIIGLIQQEKLLVGDINENILEGYLLPETYFFTYGDKKQALIDRMHQNMNKTLDELWMKRSNNLPLNSKNDALVLASIIEKETNLDSERKKVAAVFINRLKKGMKLQADPTTIYAITSGKVNFGRQLSKKDLLMESPFNTYYSVGLPPHPITNPGKASIEAALNPALTKDLFFVVNLNGGHKFTDNLLQHNKNVLEYRSKIMVRK